MSNKGLAYLYLHGQHSPLDGTIFFDELFKNAVQAVTKRHRRRECSLHPKSDVWLIKKTAADNCHLNCDGVRL